MNMSLTQILVLVVVSGALLIGGSILILNVVPMSFIMNIPLLGLPVAKILTFLKGMNPLSMMKEGMKTLEDNQLFKNIVEGEKKNQEHRMKYGSEGYCNSCSN